MTTEILGNDEVTSAQSDKFTTHNDGLRQLEGKTIRVLSKSSSGPPGSFAEGDTHIVDVASGVWAAGAVNDITHFYAGTHKFYTPIEGWRVWVNDDDREHVFDGTDWDVYTLNAAAALTAGSILFADANGDVTQDNATFFFDDTNNRIGVGTSTPDFTGDFAGTVDCDKIIVDAGTTSLPSITTDGDENSGIVFPAADQIGVTLGATRYIFVNASGVIDIENGGVINNAAGTAGAPSFAYVDSPLTGRFRAAADEEGISVAGTEVGRWIAGGLSFDGGTDAIGTYDEGTWTPALFDFTLSDSEGQTYSTQVGTYTKIGDVVHVQGNMVLTSLGTLTTSDQASVGGLPFAAENTAGNLQFIGVGLGSGFSLTAGFNVTGYIPIGASRVALQTWDVAAGTTSLLVSEFTAGGNITFGGMYKC